MAYCPQPAFVERFGQRELDQLLSAGALAGHAKAETGRTYDAAAADADAIIDSYLAMRGGIALPLPGAVPPRILELAADLTRYELYDDVKDDEAPSAVVVRRKLALDFLKMVAEAGADTIQFSARARTFTDETLAGY